MAELAGHANHQLLAKAITWAKCQQYCLILAAALQCGASVVYSEDLQHNQLINGTLRIVNPFLNLAMQNG